jgi:peptide/nickel transport system substrate-binding protein
MRRSIYGLLVVLALVAASCSSSSDDTTTTTTTAPAATTTSTPGTTQPAATTTTTEVPPDPTGGTLIVAETTPPVTFDPTQSALIKTWFPWQLSFDGLMLVQPDGSFQPRLATDWTISEDGLVHTFNLREGVVFHNGEPFEADDVVYTFERAKAEGIPYTQARVGVIDTVVALDTHTVVITLSKFDSGFMNNLANTYPVGTAIMNREAGAASDPAVFMVGTGPFKMVSYAPERELVFEANKNYWEADRPKVDNLIIRYIPEQQAQLAALQAGEVDIMFPVPETALVLAGDSNVTIQEVVSANVVRINVNSGRPPLDNVDVRRAISLAIDRQEMVDAALLGKGAPSSHIPEGYAWGIAPEDQPYNTRNIEEAKKLLADAGFPDGFELELMHLAGYGTYLDRNIEVLADQLDKIGITTTIVPLELASWLDRLLTAEYDITDNEFSFHADPFQYLRVRRERQGPAPAVIDDLEAAALAASPDELVPILQELSMTQADLVYPDIPLMARVAFTAYGNNIVGVNQDFTNSYRFLINVGKN